MALATKTFEITPASSTTATECELFQANPASFVFTLPTGQTFNGADVVRLELRAASTPGDDGLLARVSSSALPTGASVTLAFTSAQMNQPVEKTVTDYALILYATEGDTHRTLWIGTLKLNADDSTASLTADPPAVTDIYLTEEAVAAVYATIASVTALGVRVTALEAGGATDAVLHTAQTLDAGQKEQAATNIGLGVDDDVTHNSLTLVGGVNVADELGTLAGSISTNSSAIGSLSTSKMDKSSNLSDVASTATAAANIVNGNVISPSELRHSDSALGLTLRNGGSAGGLVTGLNFGNAYIAAGNGQDFEIVIYGYRVAALTWQGSTSNSVWGVTGDISVGRKLIIDRTDTSAGTTGAQTINKSAGSVNFAAAATSLVVTNSLVSTASRVLAMINTNDSTAVLKSVVSASGSFTIHMKTAPTAETNVSFLVLN